MHIVGDIEIHFTLHNYVDTVMYITYLTVALLICIGQGFANQPLSGDFGFEDQAFHHSMYQQSIFVDENSCHSLCDPLTPPNSIPMGNSDLDMEDYNIDINVWANQEESIVPATPNSPESGYMPYSNQPSPSHPLLSNAGFPICPYPPTSPTSTNSYHTDPCENIYSPPFLVNHPPYPDTPLHPQPEVPSPKKGHFTADTSKQELRRKKNNEASKVSRAKRKQKQTTLAQREKELISENKQMKDTIKLLEAEIEKFREVVISSMVH